jgi:pimeloyl-ACP methyl ester carboxylesterase
MPILEADGVTIHYERWGPPSGPKLLFLTGSGSSVAESEPMIRPFTADFDVAAQDQRGLGETSVPPGPYSMAAYAADARAVLDELDWARARVVGVSFGGMVAQELAVTWPERIERLALVCTSPGGTGGSSYPLDELAERPPAEQAEIGLRILDTRFSAEWLAEHPADAGLAELVAARRSRPADPEAARGAREQLLARRDHDVCDRLVNVTCPTLVAAGRYDGIAPLANSEFIAGQIPDAELRVYEGGHAFLFQDEAAAPDLVAFLRG